MENFKKLKKWLKLEDDHLEMYDRPMRGIYSKKDIKKGDYIVEIPSKFIIHYSDIKDNVLEEKLNNRNSDIARYLFLQENKKKSFYKPYFESMPENIDEYMFFYDKSRMEQLKHTSMFCKNSYNFEEHDKNIKEDAKTIHTYLIKKRQMPSEYMDYEKFYKIFLKYRVLVCSRVFGYTKNFMEETGLVPYADLFNHSNDSNTTWYFNDTRNSFILEATKNIKKGHEIFDSYGGKTNVQLLMYYAFTIPNNVNSILSIEHKGNVYDIGHNTKLKDLEHDNMIMDLFDFDDIKKNTSNKKRKSDNKEIIEKLKKHSKQLMLKMKGGAIKDDNILNIYNDELNIINKILNKK
jgi:hypothetical protein